MLLTHAVNIINRHAPMTLITITLHYTYYRSYTRIYTQCMHINNKISMKLKLCKSIYFYYYFFEKTFLNASIVLIRALA